MILENISLKPYNTFGFDVQARYFAEVTTLNQLKEVLQSPIAQNNKLLFLGGGSNILLLHHFDGLVIKIALKGIEFKPLNHNETLVTAGAGEVWHEFVLKTLDENLGGLENLSLIPGTVGAAPMQNIGAYGAEVKDTFYQLKALRLDTLEVETFDNAQCAFGYRESFFKHEGKGKYVILEVSFILNKSHKINASYGAILETLEEMGIKEPSIQDVSKAVIAIRQSKLPDPKHIGNSGSFFKNPEIPAQQFDELKRQYPKMPGYLLDHDAVKVPAGWLIEQCGWKGKKIGHVGVHEKQALVLVHFGEGQGEEIAQLAQEIQKSVFEKFGIKISPEVNFID